MELRGAFGKADSVWIERTKQLRAELESVQVGPDCTVFVRVIIVGSPAAPISVTSVTCLPGRLHKQAM